MDGKMESTPMHRVKSIPGDWKVVVVVPPLADDRALDGGVQEIGAETGLFAAVDRKPPAFIQEAWILERPCCWKGSGKKTLGGAISEVVGPRPPIESGDAFFALVAFDPSPDDVKGKDS